MIWSTPSIKTATLAAMTPASAHGINRHNDRTVALPDHLLLFIGTNLVD
jgi:hypothetical protein